MSIRLLHASMTFSPTEVMRSKDLHNEIQIRQTQHTTQSLVLDIKLSGLHASPAFITYVTPHHPSLALPHAVTTLVHALICFRSVLGVDLGNTIYAGLFSQNLSKLHSIPNAVARLIWGLPKFAFIWDTLSTGFL